MNGVVELLFLGTGTSAGIPMIACHCPVCSSPDPRDKRTRCSVVIRYGDSEIEVLGETRDRAGGDGQAADECPPRFQHVQIGNCPSEC
jgi:phosphoribosyl 1,2-cyclic phosphodiesterase